MGGKHQRWYFLFILLLVIAVTLLFKWVKYYRKNTYRRIAIREINNILNNDFNQLLIILRLTAIESYGRENVAGLYGIEWIEFLDSKVKNPLMRPFEGMIKDLIYQEKAPEAAQFQQLVLNTKKWIKTHVA